MHDRRKPDPIQSLVDQLRGAGPAADQSGPAPVTFNLASGAISVATGATVTLVLGGLVMMDPAKT